MRLAAALFAGSCQPVLSGPESGRVWPVLRVPVGRVSIGPAQGVPLYLCPWPQAVLLPKAAARDTKVAAQSQGRPLSPHLCLLPPGQPCRAPARRALQQSPCYASGGPGASMGSL